MVKLLLQQLNQYQYPHNGDDRSLKLNLVNTDLRPMVYYILPKTPQRHTSLLMWNTRSDYPIPEYDTDTISSHTLPDI